jgi:alkanesulfonate monooxygenase SsuD/methylene tetrahydromethanopterin reductase-like flavin-dependent oxidoreductase (luciferase family)
VEHLVKLSLYLPTMTAQRPPTDPVAAFEQIRDFAVAADEAGFATIWFPTTSCRSASRVPTSSKRGQR